MKKTSLLMTLIALTLSINCFANSVETFSELKSAVQSGDRIVLLVDLPKCTGNPMMPTGYIVPNSMMLVPASNDTLERIVTSQLHFTDHSGTPEYEYVKYTFYSDGTGFIYAATYTAKDFELKGSPFSINYTLGKGVQVIVEAVQRR